MTTRSSSLGLDYNVPSVTTVPAFSYLLADRRYYVTVRVHLAVCPYIGIFDLPVEAQQRSQVFRVQLDRGHFSYPCGGN